jgi:hypothetical protein
MFQTEVVEKIKTYFLVQHFFNRAIYEIMWKNVGQTRGDDMTQAHYMLDT